VVRYPLPEHHRSQRGGWLRAAVLGANDGILSVAGLVLGVAAASTSRSAILIAGLAGLVSGALSMAAGEYVSVSSQRDAELADLRLEEIELAADPQGELTELAEIYERRGVSAPLARKVAEELSQGDVLAVHLRDELGLEEDRRARPLQAAGASALSFVSGAVLPLVTAVLTPPPGRIPLTVIVALIALGLLGDVGARLGGAARFRATTRVVAWGAAAMAITIGIGALVGQAV
jgi:vacuolar iron transporter family protein